MSVICRTFVQNAWRSDLCSNCFKSLEDHADGRRTSGSVLAVPRYVPQAPSLYQSRGISTSLKWRLNESLYDRVARRDIASQTHVHAKPVAEETPPPGHQHPGILVKNGDSCEKKLKSRPTVDFAQEEALVIGYGGNDYDSDTSPWEMGSDDGSIDLDLLDDTDEDRKITRLTRNNTEFNSFNKNLLSGVRKEDKLNSINNNVNNQVKTTDKTISILTYNDIQSNKPEKKLNQYFFPSSTEIKSFLNSSSIILEDSPLKNNNEKMLANAKIQNLNREADQKANTGSKIALNDNFTPLNTRTYSFVSEMNKNNSNFEQSSDSDYSTCRFTAGDSTDSESFHDAEDTRHSPKSSFLHSKYVISSSQMNELDIDKKYDAGSSTSGDISNFSDDSDTHEITERTPYKLKNQKTSLTAENKISPKIEERTQINSKHELSPQFDDKDKEHENRLLEKIEEERSFQNKSPKESPKTDIKQLHQAKKDQKGKQSPPTSIKLNSESEIYHKEINNKTQMENTVKKVFSPDFKQQVSNLDFTNTTTKEKPVSKTFSKSPSLPDITPDTLEVNPSQVSKNKESPKNDRSISQDHLNTSGDTSCAIVSSKDFDNTTLPKEESKESPLEKISENNLVENVSTKEHILNDKEFKECEDNSDSEKSPAAIANRQSKLAALALELELARRDMEAKNAKPIVSPAAPLSPPEVKVRYSQSSAPNNSTPDNYPTIKKVSAISCASRLSTLPDVLQETPTKQKKTRFSLKKLLKRNKDSGTFSPASNKEVNPKAWKKQTFDRNRLSLEILHPMDLTNDVPTSADSTPTEEHKPIVSTNPGRFMFKGVSSRARSLSALPQLSNDDQSGIALLDCRKMDTVPMRKAGTVAERKKSRPSLVRTPSCSALPNRSAPPSATTSPQRSPPPKPPPPPKCSKAMHPPPPPPPPHSHPRATAPKSVTGSPARPPPPKVPETKSRSHSSGSSAQELHEQNHSDKEYANLGDIRSLITPKKPQRPSAFSAPPRDGGMEAASTTRRGGCGGEDSATIYETLPADEEEDHYTYLDETAETKTSKEAHSKNIEAVPKTKTGGENVVCARPWLDLQTSYAAIAAANYESLAELMTTTLNEGAEFFKSKENALKWRDFALDSEQQFSIVKDKAVYNAVYKSKSPGKVTLVVAPRKLPTTQNARNQTRYPVFACFSDHVPKNFVNSDNYILQESEMASVYILQRSKVTTVLKFAKDSSMDPANQYIHLRNYCFVLLQMIHTLKSLQAEGIEEINYDLQILALVETDEDKPPILVLFPEDKVNLTQCDLSNKKTLCQATLETMLHFLQIFSVDDLKTCLVNGEYLTEPVAHTFQAIAKVLSEEKASSLSQAKGFLEYMLWGPVDVKVSQSDSEDILDTILQRWLDLQRAQMVKSTISNLQNKKNLNMGPHVYEEYQLIFLLQASVKSLKNVISKL